MGQASTMTLVSPISIPLLSKCLTKKKQKINNNNNNNNYYYYYYYYYYYLYSPFNMQ